MPKLPRIVIKSANANVKHAEVSGTVTVGPESAAILSKKLGRKVEPGEEFDLGVLATYDQNPFKNFWGNLKASIRHQRSLFNKPLDQG